MIRRLALVPMLMLGVGSAQAAVIPDAAGPAMVVGPDGFGLVAYYDRASGDLKVAHCVDAACSAVTTATVDAAGEVGYAAAALAIGPGGPVIAYRNAPAQDLKLAVCADPLCASASLVTVDPEVGTAGLKSAIAIGSDGLPLIAYVTGELFAPSHELRVAHCDNADCTAVTRTVIGPSVGESATIAIGGDGLGAIVHSVYASTSRFVHCSNVACTSFSTGPTVPAPRSDGGGEPPDLYADVHPSVMIGSDGFARYAWFRIGLADSGLRVTRCLDAPCASSTFQEIPAGVGAMSIAAGADGFPRIAARVGTTFTLDTFRCLDADCATYQQSCAAGLGDNPSLVADGSGALLVAFERGTNVEVMPPPASCDVPAVVIEDASRILEGTGTQQHSLSFSIDIAPAPATPITISYSTIAGSAQPGLDYVHTAGTVTYPPGLPFSSVLVPIVADSEPELDETLQVVIGVSSNAHLADGIASGTIVDDEPPVVSVGDCSTPEGNVGSSDCAFQVTLSESAQVTMPLRVDFATSNGTATAGVDYLAAAGTLTFQPGTLSRTVTVSVLGDLAVELDEGFALGLSNPDNGTIGDGQGEGLIVDDDATPLSSLELTHGARVAADLAAAPGPVADVDFYRLAQAPYSSWEVVADEVSGDVAPGLVLERLAEDNSTVLQDGVPVGAGPARAMRWQRRVATPEVRQHIRVRSTSCTTGCGADDTYRLRVHETTGVIPRFNNAGSQVTVLILQNATSQFVQAFADFWRTDGTLAATVTVPIGPNAVGLVNTATIAALAGLSGSVTVTHDGPHGALAGKAVALEPSTGFSFDSPMVSKPR